MTAKKIPVRRGSAKQGNGLLPRHAHNTIVNRFFARVNVWRRTYSPFKAWWRRNKMAILACVALFAWTMIAFYIGFSGGIKAVLS